MDTHFPLTAVLKPLILKPTKLHIRQSKKHKKIIFSVS